MENINNKRKYNLSRFQLQELPWRNLLFLVCPQSYWTFLLLLLYQGGSSSPCLHPTHLILALELLTHRNCTERRQKKNSATSFVERKRFFAGGGESMI